jgi:hypothetical protein
MISNSMNSFTNHNGNGGFIAADLIDVFETEIIANP